MSADFLVAGIVCILFTFWTLESVYFFGIRAKIEGVFPKIYGTRGMIKLRVTVRIRSS